MVTDEISPEDFENATLPVETNGHLLFREGDKPEVEVYWLRGVPRVMGLYGRCAMCNGGWRHTVDQDKGVVRIDEPCPIPEGITTTIRLAVPSGRIVVKDSLRSVYDWCDEDRNEVKEFADYNSALGQAQVIEYMASIGCAYGPVRNSCPGLWRTGEGTYQIVSGVWDEDWADEDEEPPSVLRNPEDRLASVCTDLWAYSIADHSDWLAKGGSEEDLGWTATIVEIPRGIYEFTHHTGELGFDHHGFGETVYADIRRVGDIS